MIFSENEPRFVILLGPPGAGKGTHAGPLSKILQTPHISTGELFREQIHNQSPLGILAQKYIGLGQLVPDEVVVDMLFQRLKEPDCKKGAILDGFPRTVYQGKILANRLSEKAKILALFFAVGEEEIIKRICGRLSCKGCKKPYHIQFAPPQKPQTCDDCQEELIQRSDDKEEIIRERLLVYSKKTKALVDYYQKQNNLLKIDASQNPDIVLKNCLSALGSAQLQSV